jgi:hypothetical protein
MDLLAQPRAGESRSWISGNPLILGRGEAGQEPSDPAGSSAEKTEDERSLTRRPLLAAVVATIRDASQHESGHRADRGTHGPSNSRATPVLIAHPTPHTIRNAGQLQ